VRWLDAGTALTVQMASAGDALQPGRVLVAPGHKHIVVQRHRKVLRVDLLPGDDALYRYCPSVDALFHSVAQTCTEAAAGLLLTGMGTDGAAGLLAMRRAGAITLAQDEASCVVYGMPGAAVHRGAVQHIKKLADLPLTIQKLL
jgi:two-component system chemotaxis response regulator CheB